MDPSQQHLRRSTATSLASRGQFLAIASGAALAAGASLPVMAKAPPWRPHEVSHALVLSGGGAQGVYEAGVIGGLVACGHVADGDTLAPYGMVSGSSIGALNAWFVATGQYGALRAIWHSMAAENVFRLKSKYATLDRPHSFIGVRVRAALRLAAGLSKSDDGIIETKPILDWMTAHIDPKMPVLVPLVWSVTNLTTQSAETFYRLPASLRHPVASELLAALRLGLGEDAVIREASDAMLHQTLLASAATPVMIDPVIMPMADGSPGFYVDGSVASNGSISVARTVARAVHVVFVDARHRETQYKNAIDIVLGSYETMQHKMLESELREVYFQTLAKRSSERLPAGSKAELEGGSPELVTFFRDLPAVDLAYLRPQGRLPAGFAAFDDQKGLDAAYAIGERDGARGFEPYDWKSFRL